MLTALVPKRKSSDIPMLCIWVLIQQVTPFSLLEVVVNSYKTKITSKDHVQGDEPGQSSAQGSYKPLAIALPGLYFKFRYSGYCTISKAYSCRIHPIPVSPVELCIVGLQLPTAHDQCKLAESARGQPCSWPSSPLLPDHKLVSCPWVETGLG